MISRQLNTRVCVPGRCRRGAAVALRVATAAACTAGVLFSRSLAQEPLDGAAGRPLALDQFRPRSMLRLPEHHPRGAKFPCVDVHVHCRLKLRQTDAALDEFVRLMDEQNIALGVSLDGELGDRLEEHLRFLDARHRDRFVVLANIDWRGKASPNEPANWACHRADFAHQTVAALADAKSRGAVGVKVFKDLGLVYRNPDGTLIAVDDPRWDPIWRACGDLGLPVLIHTADPPAFFQPVDRFNERWEELQRHPEWSFSAAEFPAHRELLDQLLRVVARHRETTFIAAHLANNAECLTELGQWLDAHPNLYLDLAARIAELGRQPFSARQFLLKYADRVLFGTDGPRSPGRLAPHWRMLETRDEYFPYAEEEFPPQGLWRIYGLNLPDDVLTKIYSQNAARIVPGIAERLARQQARRDRPEQDPARSYGER